MEVIEGIFVVVLSLAILLMAITAFISVLKN